MLTFEKHPQIDVHCAMGRVRLRGREHDLPLRVDAREARVRVDVEKPLVPVWEAIDGGKGFATVEEGKAHAERWLAAVEAQQTLSPRL